jgi:hypothetical protein
MTDPLDAIKARWHVGQPRQVGAPLWREQTDVDLLVAEIDTLRDRVKEWERAAGAEAELADERNREVARLRGLLGRLEWAGTYCDRDREMAACPVCDVVADSPVVGQRPHAADCWLAAAIRPASPDPPEGPQP